MNATLTKSGIRLQVEELEPRVLLAASSPFNDSGVDLMASSALFGTATSGVLSGSVFSTAGGFSAAGFPTGGGFPTNVGFPTVALPTGTQFSTGAGFPIGAEFSNSGNFHTGSSQGVALPDGDGPSGVGLPDASAVGEVLALGGNARSEALGGVLTKRFESPGDGAPDATSGVGQMVIATGANSNGGSILPTSGFSSGSGGTGGPIGGHAKPNEQKGGDRIDAPGSDAAPGVKAGLLDDGAAMPRNPDADSDLAMSIFKDASGQ